jgi:dolichyl-phosphate beta-glucosyltransferase
LACRVVNSAHSAHFTWVEHFCRSTLTGFVECSTTQNPKSEIRSRGLSPILSIAALGFGRGIRFMDARKGGLASLIFPTYNPGLLMQRTWGELVGFLESARGAWEVVFVCDGCTDGTPNRLADWLGSARNSPAMSKSTIRVLSYAPNRGKGYALRAGLAAAQGAWRIFTDVDLAYSFEDITRVANTLRAGADVAIASRTHRDSRIVAPVHLQGYVYRRHLQSLIFSTMVRLLLPVRQSDTQAGLKGLSARAAELLVPRLHCNGFEFDCELLTACARYNLPICEVPICVRYDHRHSTTSWRSTLRMFRALWQIGKTWPTPLPLPPDWNAEQLTRREAA